MDTFYKLLSGLAAVPDWVSFLLLPVLTVIAAVSFTVFGKRKIYFPVALFLLGAGVSFVSSRQAYESAERAAGIALAYAGLYLAFSAALSLLFLCPTAKFKKQRRKSKADELYEKFHEELREKPFVSTEKRPPKVCCFEERSDGREGNDTRLTYVDTLIQKLRAEKLSASDRLEVEELARTIDRFRAKSLNAEEQDSFNDALASVLRLTAKYKL